MACSDMSVKLFWPSATSALTTSSMVSVMSEKYCFMMRSTRSCAGKRAPR
jgi:hypothetical protein